MVAAEKHSRAEYLQDWSVDRIHRTVRQDDHYASEIAKLFLEGSSNPLLSDLVADFYLDQMYLPDNWSSLLMDESLCGTGGQTDVAGNYSVQRGRHVEENSSR